MSRACAVPWHNHNKAFRVLPAPWPFDLVSVILTRNFLRRELSSAGKTFTIDFGFRA